MLENFSDPVVAKVFPSCLVNGTKRFRYKAAIAQITSFVIIVCGVLLEIPVFTSR
jgi:hypothetical protein